jgi:hypothetical protein
MGSNGSAWDGWLALLAAAGVLGLGCGLDASGLAPDPSGSGATATTTGPGLGGSGATGGMGLAGATGGAAGQGGSPSTGGSGGHGGQGGQGGSCNFAPPNTCDGAQELPSVSGQVTSAGQSAAGIGSEWFQIFISETQGNPGVPLSYTVSLTSPMGMDYDLYVYEGATAPSVSAQPNCQATPAKGVGDPESVTHQWAETSSPDNDGRWLSIEVRYVSGSSCAGDSQWSLTVMGHS